MSMTSSRPYLVRAFYDWIVDNECTPYILVDALVDDVLVPQDYVNPDGQIVLNISPNAVNDFVMGEDSIHFSARFGGVPTDLFVPCRAILGIYTKENQQGMIFEPETNPETPPPKPSGSKQKSEHKNRAGLKVVK